MARPGQCNTDNNATNTANIGIAVNRHGSANRVFSEVDVLITRVEGSQITFKARGTDGQTRDHGPVEWGDETKMWVYCPSSLPSQAERADQADPGPPPAVGATGRLLLSSEFSASEGIRARAPKFPRNLPIRDEFLAQELVVELEGLVLDGILVTEGAQRAATLDLRDRDLVPEQTIEIGDDLVRISLTEKGFEALEIRPTPTGQALFFPTHVSLRGIEKELREPATVDLMDPNFASPRQTISLGGDEVRPVLTGRGFARFGRNIQL